MLLFMSGAGKSLHRTRLKIRNLLDKCRNLLLFQRLVQIKRASFRT